MRIHEAELRLIGLRLREPFRISSGVTRERRILLVRLRGDGVEGWGECVAGEEPNYSYETVETARILLERHLLPAVLGRDHEGPAGVGAALDRAARGHPMAKAAVEMASWDLAARARGISLATALGGSRTAVPTGVSVGLQEDTDGLLSRVEAYVLEGYRRIKLKIAPGRDLDLVEAVRARFPEVPLTVDANAAYGPGDAELLLKLDSFGLAMIEQPYGAEELVELAGLQRQLATPICLDESITGPGTCTTALRLGSGRIVNIKPGRVGGHGASLRIHDRCAAAGVPVWCGGMLESGIGRAHNVALASLPNFTLPGDTSASRRYWERDIVTPEFVLAPDGTVAVPTGRGIGVEVDEEFLAAVEIERVRIERPS